MPTPRLQKHWWEHKSTGCGLSRPFQVRQGWYDSNWANRSRNISVSSRSRNSSPRWSKWVCFSVFPKCSIPECLVWYPHQAVNPRANSNFELDRTDTLHRYASSVVFKKYFNYERLTPRPSNIEHGRFQQDSASRSACFWNIIQRRSTLTG